VGALEGAMGAAEALIFVAVAAAVASGTWGAAAEVVATSGADAGGSALR
jgi:hypothetical protein